MMKGGTGRLPTQGRNGEVHPAIQAGRPRKITWTFLSEHPSGAQPSSFESRESCPGSFAAAPGGLSSSGPRTCRRRHHNLGRPEARPTRRTRTRHHRARWKEDSRNQPPRWTVSGESEWMMERACRRLQSSPDSRKAPALFFRDGPTSDRGPSVKRLQSDQGPAPRLRTQWSVKKVPGIASTAGMWHFTQPSRVDTRHVLWTVPP